jgi:hypothetical protein
MMRPDTEVPSDFQDYTLVALIGVAVHLSGASPSEPAVLPSRSSPCTAMRVSFWARLATLVMTVCLILIAHAWLLLQVCQCTTARP